MTHSLLQKIKTLYQYFFPSTESGCPKITTPANGEIVYLDSDATARVFCEPNYETVGSAFAYCNGTHWDRAVGTCRETDKAPATSCDFESKCMCG